MAWGSWSWPPWACRSLRKKRCWDAGGGRIAPAEPGCATGAEPTERGAFYSLGMKALRRLVSFAATGMATLSASVWAQPAASLDPAGFNGIKAIARASRDATLSFTFPAEVSKVLVKGGQKVNQGDLLVQSR